MEPYEIEDNNKDHEILDDFEPKDGFIATPEHPADTNDERERQILNDIKQNLEEVCKGYTFQPMEKNVSVKISDNITLNKPYKRLPTQKECHKYLIDLLRSIRYVHPYIHMSQATYKTLKGQIRHNYLESVINYLKKWKMDDYIQLYEDYCHSFHTYQDITIAFNQVIPAITCDIVLGKFNFDEEEDE